MRNILIVALLLLSTVPAYARTSHDGDDDRPKITSRNLSLRERMPSTLRPACDNHDGADTITLEADTLHAAMPTDSAADGNQPKNARAIGTSSSRATKTIPSTRSST